MQMFLTKACVDQILASVHAHIVGGPFNGCFDLAFVALATDGPDPTLGVTLADYTEATFNGYARAAIGVPGAIFSHNGREKIVWPSKQFTPTDAVKPETITHILIVSLAVAGDLLAVVTLDAPYSLPDADSALVYVPEFGLRGDESVGDGSLAA